ncbi:MULTISPECIES: hypothetical protein [Streptomyces]|uniref:Uncharacterized protein n=1 Tax=Streptomyces griseocarneus TaxID=51201 RepID=A0ABX7RMX6_9ACTN|nr:MULTISPECIES: hypothetical protein [Streptomyces]QSY49132.1 hypothetical protein J3S04_29825 [Streptomyces griseocarneus]
MTPSWEPLWPYRAVLAVDARNFSAHNSTGMQQVNAVIQQVLAQALSAVGLSARWEQRAFPQHTGDGYVAGMDPEVLPGLVGCFPDALSQVLHDYRRHNPGQPALQLRVSIHVGPLPPTGLGVPMVETHRLLDHDALRDLLARANPELTNTAVVISQRVHEDVFRSGLATGGTLPAHYARSFAKVKTFEQPAWLHVPGLDWGLADPAIFETADAGTQQSASQPSSRTPSEAQAQASSPAPAAVSFTQNGDGNVQGQHQHFNGFGGLR